MWDSGDTTPRNESSPETVPALANLPPPSPVVMRYWKQCAGAEDDEEECQNEEDQGEFETLLEVSYTICSINSSLLVLWACLKSGLVWIK